MLFYSAAPLVAQGRSIESFLVWRMTESLDMIAKNETNRQSGELVWLEDLAIFQVS